MSSFLVLARNDIGLQMGRLRRKHRYLWLYLVIAAFVWLFQYALLLNGSSGFPIDPRYALLFIIPLFFAVSGTVVSREWRKDTAGWWLSFPCSRLRLLLAKTAASFINKLLILLAMAAMLVLLFLGIILVRPELITPGAPFKYLSQAMEFLALTLVLCPAAVTSGILMRLVPRSKWRIASPLVWIAVPMAFVSLIFPFAGGGLAGQPFIDTVYRVLQGGNILLCLLVQVGFSVAVTLLSLYLLCRKIEL